MVFRCDGLEHVHYVVVCTYAMSTGLKYEFSNRRDKAIIKELVNIFYTPASSYSCEHTWKHQTGAVSLFCMLSTNSLTAETFAAFGFCGTDVRFGGEKGQTIKKNQCNQLEAMV